MTKIIIDGVTFIKQKKSTAMKTVGTRLPLEVIELLEKRAKELDISKTTLMRFYICKGLKFG
tara:strand:- start:255 stop:440 length:186 start_codon:yes stop_codon:yes gene_type:complete